MRDYATPVTHVAMLAGLACETIVDCGRLTSEGSRAWLAQMDAELGVGEALAHHVPDWRRGQVRHVFLTWVRQRVDQIACGYADQIERPWELSVGELP